MQRYAAAVLVLCVLFLHANPAIAQWSSASGHARVSFTSVHQYVAGEAIPRQLAIPPNIVVSSMYRPLFESMLRQSPTFRRQCMRIAAEAVADGSCRDHAALPGYRRPRDDAVDAERQGPSLCRGPDLHLKDVEELIAHEFEHIIEQLDGVDLAAHAAQRHTGVTAIGHGRDMFETMRAKRAGLKVVSELGL